MTQAVMQQQRAAGLGLVLVLVAGVWVLMRAAQNGGGGGTEGPATVSGALGAATVGQPARMGRRSAFMRRHLLDKSFGAQITAAVSVIGGTRNADGIAINWPMELVIRFGHNTLLGWRMPQELDAAWPLGHAVNPTSHTGDRAFSRTFETPPDADQEWDVRAWLFALRSDESGNPMGSSSDFIGASVPLSAPSGLPSMVEDVVVGATTWGWLDYSEHPGAVRSTAPAAAVAGELGIVTVTQPCLETA